MLASLSAALSFYPPSHTITSLLPLYFLNRQSLIFSCHPSAFMVHFMAITLTVAPVSPTPGLPLPEATIYSFVTMVTPSLIPLNVPTVVANSFTLGSSFSLPSLPLLPTTVNIGNYFSSLLVRDT